MNVLLDISDWVKKNKRVTLIGIGIVCAYFLNDYMGMAHLPKSWLTFGVLVLVGMFAGAWWYEFRYKTHHIIGPDFHKSYKNYYDTTDGYRVMPLGSIDAGEFSWNGGEGTLIALKRYFTKFGNEMLINAKGVKTDYACLPRTVKSVVASNQYPGCGPPFLFAEYPHIPLTLWTAAKGFIDRLRTKLKNPLTNKNVENILMNFGRLEDEFSDYIKVNIKKELKSDYEAELRLAEDKLKQKEAHIEFLEGMLAGKNEEIVKAADTAAAINKAFQPSRMRRYILPERRREEQEQ